MLDFFVNKTFKDHLKMEHVKDLIQITGNEEDSGKLRSSHVHRTDVRMPVPVQTLNQCFSKV